MIEELTQLLENNSPDLFYRFIKTFAESYDGDDWERSGTGEICNYTKVRYLETDTGELIHINVRDLKSQYSFYKSSIEQLTRDYKRFLKLKAFL